MNSFMMTLNRHLVEQERLYPQATGAFTSLLSDIALAAKVISHQVNKAGLLDILGLAGSRNVFGEEQQKLDVFANEAMIRSLRFGGTLCAMVSEEDEELIPIPDEFPRGKYVCCFDPLDGSSNIDVNVSIGTIFSIYRRITPEDAPGKLEDILQPGYSQLCAGYVVYGSSTMLVYTTGAGVHGFTLDPTYGSFVLSHPKIKTPSKGKIYSANESNYDDWEPGVQNYIRWAKKSTSANGGGMNSRYIGSLVADFHRNLLKGGVFLYPGDHTNPQGKLRLLYEANPLAFIVEQAGGKATDGRRRILDIPPDNLHQHTPLILGSKDDVETAMEFIQGKRKS
ncbi:MAG: class 1 fructose-bisphosphatase [Calditrichaceae bacterium]|nr:class 1 fructose-bisphosphatase [Calditrichia bacterium]NUQ43251.1 class 1 fructose-bisphosphatase [Calditrichaceae bacterium]